MSLFSKSKKEKPSSLVKNCRTGLQNFLKHKGGSKGEKAIADSSAAIMSMKAVLYGDGKIEPIPEAGDELVAEIFSGDLLSLLLQNLAYVEFEVTFLVPFLLSCILLTTHIYVWNFFWFEKRRSHFSNLVSIIRLRKILWLFLAI